MTILSFSLAILGSGAAFGFLFASFIASIDHPRLTSKLLLLSLGAGLLGIVMWCVWVSSAKGIDYSQGERSGRVVKLSKRGIIWPTWEGELQLAGDSSFSASTWDFTVQSDAIAAELTKHITTGDRIVVAYREFFLRGPAFGFTGYDVVEVRK